ncbi:hypothetical protein PQX77_010214 [Marasmius sp. AFHP31]|nr:hypothetical protein PQX77_010214 [Marasmius sp. AFHP31]
MAAESTERRQTTPLPKLQTALALLIAHAEPVTAQVIYPFIPAFVYKTGITNGDEKKTGYYAGIIESLFFVAECLTVFHWGRISDRIGRRPVLLIGPLGLTFAMLGFGLSKTFWHMVVFRCAQGVFNGNLGVVKTLIAEFTDDTNLADAFFLLSLAWNVGGTIGPALGGILSDPADRWPSIFGNAFFRNNPYFLPCAAAAFFALTAFLPCLFFLKETLATRSRAGTDVVSSSSERDPLLRSEPSHDQDPKELTLYEIVSFTHMSHRVVLPLVYSTSIPEGGLGLSPYQIGVILAIYGICNAFLQILVYKPILKHIGPKRIIAAARAGRVNGLVWGLIVAQMSSSTLAATASNAVATMVIKSAPPNALGAVNGIQQMISSALRGSSPLVVSPLFAVSLVLDLRISGGTGGLFRYLVDITQMLIVVAGLIHGHYKLSAMTGPSNKSLSTSIMADHTAVTERLRTTPLPKLQTALALLIAHAEPVTAHVIYPFIPAFILKTGITNGDEKRTGYYSGIIESLFFVTECLTVFHWGRMSDRVGRRPVLLIGPLGLTFAMLGFGLSKTFWHMVVFRCAQGVFNGNLGVVKTLMAEFTDDTNLSDAFMLLSLTWNVGGTIGPALGGILSDPANRWPRIFGNAFFRDNPYLLPCAAAAMFAFIGFLGCLLFLKETHKTRAKIEMNIASPPSERDPLVQRDHGRDQAQLTIYEIVIPNRPLQRTLICHAFQAFTQMSHRVVLPLVYSTSIPEGGLGLSPFQIGMILAIYGVCNALLQILVYNPILKKIGPKRMFTLSYSFHLIRIFVMMLARIVAAQAGCVNWLVWTLIIMQMCSSTLADTTINAVATLIVKSAPPNALGAVNGIQQMISSALRGSSPLVVSPLFAVSLVLDLRISGGTGGAWCSLKLPSYRLI